MTHLTLIETATRHAQLPENRRVRSRRLADQLRAIIERQIDDGRLKPGERLATERELAFQYKTSRNVVRTALAELGEAGKVTRHVGRGTFVAESAPQIQATDGFKIADASPLELMEFRLLIEPGFADAAVLHASESDIQAIMKCLDQGDAAERWEQFEYWDHTFHRLLVSATHNRLFISLYDAVTLVRRNATWGKLKQQSTDPKRWQTYQADHRRIGEALRERDADTARAAIREHLMRVRAKMLGY